MKRFVLSFRKRHLEHFVLFLFLVFSVCLAEAQEDLDSIPIDGEDSITSPSYSPIEMDEGSGAGIDDEDDHQIVPSRVVPKLQTPSFNSWTPDERNENTKYSFISPSSISILTDEGSGDYYPEDISPSSPLLSSSATEIPKIPTSVPTNHPPFIHRRLIKHGVTLGKLTVLKIPEDTFMDEEDGHLTNWTLYFQNEKEIPKDFWLQLDPFSTRIQALPVDPNTVGRYIFVLKAHDSYNVSIMDTLEIVVQNYPSSRLFNHKFVMNYSMIQPTSPHPQFLLPSKVSEFMEGDLRDIVIREMSSSSLSWTYRALLVVNCPMDRLVSLSQRLLTNHKTPSKVFSDFLGPNIKVVSLMIIYEHFCYEERLSKGHNINSKNNSQPVIRNPIDKIEVRAGEMLRFKVPKDTCYDKDDLGTENLHLQLLTMDRKELPLNAWLQFDVKNQEFYGVPLEEEVGRVRYQLVCSDRQGLSAIDGIEVVVSTRPFSERTFVEFDFLFDSSNTRSSAMDTPARKKVSFLQNLATYFKDPDTRHIVLKSVNEDFTRVVWRNKSLLDSESECNSESLFWMKSKLWKNPKLYSGKRIGLKDELLKALSSSFLSLKSISLIYKGFCASSTFSSSESSIDVPQTEVTNYNTRTFFHGLITYSDYLLTFIFPGVIISIMMCFAILLACLLHRKRRAGKNTSFYGENFPSPRLPVILKDELMEDEHRGRENEREEELSDKHESLSYKPFIYTDEASSSLLATSHENKFSSYSHRNDVSFTRSVPIYQRT